MTPPSAGLQQAKDLMSVHIPSSTVRAAVAAIALGAASLAAADQGHDHGAPSPPKAAAEGHGHSHEHAAGHSEGNAGGHSEGHAAEHGHSGAGHHGDAAGHDRAAGHAPAAPQRTADAAVIYHEYCSVCHGDRGDGDSRARGSMVPPPRDFTAPEARGLTREAMIAVVTNGKDGTAMAPWKTQLEPEQIAAVVDYVRERFIAPGESASNEKGARIFARTCSVCHGDNGAGAVWASANLDPRPRDFTSVQSASELTRERMIHSVTYGRADTAMPGFGTQLDSGQVEAVVDYVRATFMRPMAVTAAADTGHGGGHGASGHGDGHGHDHSAHLGSDVEAMRSTPFDGGLVGDVARGRTLYQDNCVACHGEQGNGQGPRAYFILPKPRNFTHPASRSSMNRPHLFEAISRGRVGSEMAAWDTVLDPQSIADIAEYVFQRFILGETVGAASGAAAGVAARQ